MFISIHPILTLVTSLSLLGPHAHSAEGMDDVDWVAETLMRNGNREAWIIGRRLCR